MHTCRLLAHSFVTVIVIAGCSDSKSGTDDSIRQGNGGDLSRGGAQATGGAQPSGGIPNQGGMLSYGGSALSAGGSQSSGGSATGGVQVSSGGGQAAGGNTTGGASVETGGNSSRGGAATGGKSVGGSFGGTNPVGGNGTGGTTSAGAATGGKATGGANLGGTSAGGASAGGASAGGAIGMTWTNPIVPQRADPHVWLHSDGYYYLAATVPEYNRIELRRSTTLGGLTTAQAKTVWTRPTSGAMAGPIWAPEIHPIDGKWYVYFSAGQGGQPWDSIRVFAMENASANPLEGTWTVKGQVATKWDSFTLDATTFVHASVRYFVWTQVEPGKVGTNIMIAKMSSPTALTGEQVILSRPTYSWETQGGVWVNEAPAAVVKNGKVFITYSASATDANYCMGLLTANADSNLLLASSWTKASQPVFKSNDGTSQYGPGHNSFTTTTDGKVDILVYHARNYKDIPGGNALGNPDRATRAQALTWKADGTPDFAVPVADGSYTVVAP